MARVSFMTYNVWGSNLWPERKASLASTLSRARPDVLLLQEVTPDIISCVEEALPNHAHVVDPNGMRGWWQESQIFWRRDQLRLVNSGFTSYQSDEYPDRGLFWVRLQSLSDENIRFVASTVHLPWMGCKRELHTGVNMRVVALTPVVEALQALVQPTDVACILGGDFNEAFHPIRVLNAAGFYDVFQLCDVKASTTHPNRPSAPEEEKCPDRTLDWIVCSMPSPCRVLACMVKTERGGFPPPSDHMPVLAVIELSW